jgi:hypothetical protein
VAQPVLNVQHAVRLAIERGQIRIDDRALLCGKRVPGCDRVRNQVCKLEIAALEQVSGQIVLAAEVLEEGRVGESRRSWSAASEGGRSIIAT